MYGNWSRETTQLLIRSIFIILNYSTQDVRQWVKNHNHHWVKLKLFLYNKDN